MHEPLPRSMRIRDQQNSVLLLFKACAFVVILAITAVGIAVIAGKLAFDGPDQVALVKRTTASAAGPRDAAPSSNDLFSGMPLP